MNFKKNELIELTISKYAFEGKGIAKINSEDKNNFVVFVEGSYPNDKVLAQIKKIKKNYVEAKAIEIISPSELRVEPRCKYFGVCGGCKQQDLEYSSQINYKQMQVEEIFNKIGGLTDFEIMPIIPSEKKFFYRNKMEFSFAEKRWLTEKEIKTDEIIDRDFALGLHIPNLFDKVLDINECFLQSELSNKILNHTRDFFKSKNTSIFSTFGHSGYLRNLAVRQSNMTNDLMINLVTFYDDENIMNEYRDYILNLVPEVTTIVNNISIKKALVAIGDYEKIFYGEGFITDKIGKFNFRISSNSFFQTNTLQAENLYKTALNFCDLNGNEIVYDLFAGTGTISIFISSAAKEIFAFETTDSAIADAEINKKINEIDNVNFIKADLYNSFLPVLEFKKIPKPEVIIVDPPRNGMHKNTVEDLLNLEPDKIIYISCNPATQARDIKLLAEKKYQLIKTQAVDMFPHTYHIENVALLKRK